MVESIVIKVGDKRIEVTVSEAHGLLASLKQLLEPRQPKETFVYGPPLTVRTPQAITRPLANSSMGEQDA